MNATASRVKQMQKPATARGGFIPFIGVHASFKLLEACAERGRGTVTSQWDWYIHPASPIFGTLSCQWSEKDIEKPSAGDWSHETALELQELGLGWQEPEAAHSWTRTNSGHWQNARAANACMPRALTISYTWMLGWGSMMGGERRDCTAADRMQSGFAGWWHADAADNIRQSADSQGKDSYWYWYLKCLVYRGTNPLQIHGHFFVQSGISCPGSEISVEFLLNQGYLSSKRLINLKPLPWLSAAKLQKQNLFQIFGSVSPVQDHCLPLW